MLEAWHATTVINGLFIMLSSRRSDDVNGRVAPIIPNVAGPRIWQNRPGLARAMVWTPAAAFVIVRAKWRSAGEAPMLQFLRQFFTWWNGQTLGTRFYTWRHGEFVGEDEFGNRYYRSLGGKKDPALGFERRWVIYAGETEASATPTGWYGWLHHTVNVPPTAESYRPYAWEKPFQPNQTGTPLAYRPQGSTLRAGRRPAATGDYAAWSPDS
jgi:NADH:ubiquinone oxidoreductase subunit